MVRRLVSILGLVCATACAGTRHAPPAIAVAIPDIPVEPFVLVLPALGGGPCVGCLATSLTPDVVLAIEKRLAELKQRGGDCASYAAVLESSYRSGQITIRPYMWRVGPYLASGEARPSGEMILARDIDSLNVGVRTLDDLLHSMEHEAAHIAFHLTSGGSVPEKRANDYVEACRA
jgi:hypothetical protein